MNWFIYVCSFEVVTQKWKEKEPLGYNLAMCFMNVEPIKLQILGYKL